MTWHPEELGDVAANRDVAFPPLHADDDDGTVDTVLSIRVPYKVNPARRKQLNESLIAWAQDQGLLDWLAEEATVVSFVNWPKKKEENA